MRAAVVVCSLVVVVAVAVVAGGGCGPAESPAEGEGDEGEGDEGGEGEGDAGEGEGEGDVADCTVDGCGEGEECGSIFIGAPDSACFATCSDGAVPCTTAVGDTGECRVINAFENPVCRSQAENLGRCGNEVNAGCLDDDAVCVAFDDAGLFPGGEATCVRACDVDGDCGDGLGCSLDLQFLVSGDPAPHGVCAPLSTVGAACGKRGDGALRLCTSDQQCDRGAGESQGACVASP